MKKGSKKRLCWNCEGSVTLEAETCPYCGVSVVPASLDNISSGFMPAYRHGDSHDSAIPKSPYTFHSHSHTHSHQDDSLEGATVSSTESEGASDNDEDEPAYDEFQRTLLATVLLLTGSVFFMFGFALMLFSNDGVLTLQWDATLWFIYLALALPLILFGWRYLSKLEA